MKKMKKILCLCLVGIMILAMTACGKEEAGKDGEGTKGGTVTADPSVAKQYVFRGQELNLGMDFNNMNLYSMVCKDNRIYMVYQEYGMAKGGTAQAAVVYPVVDGDMAVEILPEDGEVIEDYEMELPTYYLVSVNTDGSDKKVSQLQMDSEDNSGWMSTIHLMQDGTVIGLYESGQEDLTDPQMPVWVSSYSLIKWDNEGNQVWNTKISTGNDEYIYAQAMLQDKNNNIVLVSGDNVLYTFDMNGKELSRKEMTNIGVNNLGNVIVKKDGSVYFTSYNDDWTKIYISKLDVENVTLSEKQELPGNMANYSIMAGDSTDFILTDNNGVYTYNLGDAEPAKFMDYINSDLATYSLNNINLINDKEFIATYNDPIDWTLKVSKFVYVDPSEIPDKSNITIGCNWMDVEVKQRIIDFNKTSDKYRITIKDYSTYNTMEDYTLSQTQMNNDIISGKMPDIMIIDGSQDISSWVNKGLLADVSELIAKDEELSKNEYLENVFKAFSVNDKLYTVVPSFAVQTMIARTDMVENRDNWTMTEFMDYMSTKSDDVSAFGEDMVRETVLYYIMQYCGSDFVDVNTGNCSFDSPEFIAMLEFAKTFPKEYAEDYWENYDWEATQSMYRDKKAVLMSCYIYRMQDLVSSIHGTLGAEASFIGFPGMNGNTSIIVPSGNNFVISAKSANIEAAWEFVRYYLTEEYQKNNDMYSLPVLKTAFEENTKMAMEKPYWENEETGEKEYYDYTFYINGEEIILEPFSQKEVTEISDFIYSIDKRGYYNEGIINIVKEEAESFFSGQKSAKDVAQVIQSRVQIYVDENR